MESTGDETRHVVAFCLPQRQEAIRAAAVGRSGAKHKLHLRASPTKESRWRVPKFKKRVLTNSTIGGDCRGDD